MDERYERLRVLGEGSYGTAFLVRERDGSAQYVAKEIRIGHLGEKERSLALSEAQVLRRLQHANIIRYVDSWVQAQLLYIIMEYADNGDLAQQIQQRRDATSHFTESEVMQIHVQLVLALSHIHSMKILHRDLKPLNIFLTHQWIVKLGDFGISKVLESSTAGAHTTIGTPLYLSPEICRGEPYGAKSDLWALGVVTYEMAALRVPFSATSVVHLVMKVCSVEPEPLPLGRYSRQLGGIIFGLLQKEPSRRLTLEDLLRMPYAREHLRKLLAQSEAESSPLASTTRLSHPLAPSLSPTQDTAAAVRAEFHRNREAARLARERCRGSLERVERVERVVATPERAPERPRVVVTPERVPERPVDRREEVKRKSREQKEALEALRLKELEEARQQAFQERVVAKQRLEHQRASSLGRGETASRSASDASPSHLEASPRHEKARSMDLLALRSVLQEALEVEERTVKLEDFQQTLRPEPPPEVVVEPPSLAEQTIRPDERPLRPADLSYLSALLEGTQDSLTYSPESSGLEPVAAGSPPELGAKEQGSLGPQLLAPEGRREEVKTEVISLHLAQEAPAAPPPVDVPEEVGDVRPRCQRFCSMM